MKTLQSKALSTMISVVLYSAAFLGMAAFVEQFFGGNWTELGTGHSASVCCHRRDYGRKNIMK